MMDNKFTKKKLFYKILLY